MFRRFGMVGLVRILRDTPTEGSQQAPAPAGKETFSREYVHELREENKNIRLKHQESEAARKAAEDKAKAAEESANQKITEATTAAKTAADQRVIKAEMKALALKEGIVDLDDLALIDTSTITIEEDGSLKGVEDALKKFKEAKPHKFGASSSSSTEPPPKKKDDEPKNVKDMTPEERRAEAKKLGIKF